MTQPIVLKTLEELGRFADLLVPADRANEERALVPVLVEPIIEPDLDALAEAASRAAQELRQLAAADARARQEAEEGAREEAARREAEERQREDRLKQALTRAEALVREQKFDEARRLLGPPRAKASQQARPGLVHRQDTAAGVGRQDRARGGSAAPGPAAMPTGAS